MDKNLKIIPFEEFVKQHGGLAETVKLLERCANNTLDTTSKELQLSLARFLKESNNG